MGGVVSRTVRVRVESLVGMFVMLSVTATIVAATAQIMATALGAPGPGRFSSADAVVRANATVTLGHGDNVDKIDVQRPALLPAAAVARAAAVPGVRSAVGDVTFPVTVIGRGGTPVPASGGVPAHGHGWASASLTPYRLGQGRIPSRPDDIVLDLGIARDGGFNVGDRVKVVSPAAASTFRVVGLAVASRSEQDRQSSVFFTGERAQQLSGLGPGFNAIAIRAAPGVDGLHLRGQLGDAVGGGAQVLDHRHASSADAGDPGAFDRVQLVAVIAAGGGMTVAIAVFVAAGMIAFAAEGRRREIALLRAVGATPGQVRRMLLGETALIGLLAGTAGCLVATALFTPFAHALVSVGLAPYGFRVAPNWIPYTIATAVGVVVAVLATLLPARRALAVRPGEALVESLLPPRRLSFRRGMLGLMALGGGLTIVIVLSSHAISYATLAAVLFTIGVALLGPLIVGWPTALAGRLLPGGAGFLAGSALGNGRFRTGAVGAAIALVVALTGTQVLGLATAQRATERTTAQRVQAERVLVARGGSGLPPFVAQAAARLPGAAAAGTVSTNVFLLDHGLTNQGSSWDAAGLDPSAARGMLDLDVRAGSLEAVRGVSVAVSDALAHDGHVRLGDVLRARLADATPARLRVVAIYHRANGLGDIVLPHELALTHATSALDSVVFITGRNPAAIRGLNAIAHAVPTAVVRTRGAYLDDVKAQGQQNARAQWVIAALMIVTAVMAAFNTGAMAAAERRRELVLARLCGATRAQVFCALTLESILATVAGIGVGILVVLASLAGAGSDPSGGPLAVPWSQIGLVLAGGVAIGLIGTLLPAVLVGRARLTALAGLRE
jgi:putative ABC transport system permease protein